MTTEKVFETEISTPPLSDQPTLHTRLYSQPVCSQRCEALLHGFTEDRVVNLSISGNKAAVLSLFLKTYSLITYKSSIIE